MKKLAAFMLTVLMVLGMCTFAAYADADISIATYDDLVAWATNGSNDSGKTVVLTADVAAPADAAWTPKSSFAGVFDGQGYSISGLKASGGGCGFIKSLSGTVKNLYMLDGSFTEGSGNATIACSTSGSATVVENVYSNFTISGDSSCGGILAHLGGATTVTGCWFDGDVSVGSNYVSGLVGNQESNDLVITDCLNTGKVSAGNFCGAGISCAVYDGKTTMTRCINNGDVSDQSGLGFAFCRTVTHRKDAPGECHLVSCYNRIGSSKNYPNDVRDNAVFDGEVIEFRSFSNLGTFADLNGYWCVIKHNGSTIIAPKFFGGENPVDIPVYEVNDPAITAFEVKAEGHWGPRWTVELELPEGFTSENVQLGLLAIPEKAIPKDHELIIEETEYEYNGNVYPVANAEAAILRDSEDGKVVATFVITDLSVKTIRSNYAVRPYVIYKVAEGDIVLYGEASTQNFYVEAKLTEDAELKAKADAVLAPVDAEIGPDFVVSRDWCFVDAFEQVPAMVVDGTTINPAEDKGLGEYTVIVDGTEGQAAQYVELLQKCGFEKQYENELTEGVNIVQLTKDNVLVTVNDIAYQNKTFISAICNQPLSPHLEDKYQSEAQAGAVTTLHQINTYWWGDSYVIKLKNGHFIIIDGAAQCELTYLLDYLETLVPAGEKPVIEAWCCTHLHMDHFYLLQDFNVHPEWLDRIYVEGFYFNEPSDGVKDLDSGVYNEIKGERLAISKLKTTAGTTPEIYRPMIGQCYWFCDVKMEIILSQEMVLLDDYTGGFNDSSTWYKFTMDGQTFIEGGDGHRADMKFLIRSYDPEDLQCDFFSVLHHGSNTWEDYTRYVGVWKTVLFPTMARDTGTLNAARNMDLRMKCEEYYVAGEGTDIFYLPYTIGKEGTDGGHVKLPDLPEHHS
ncbi:MAG: hypothetical protein IJV00_05700 [Clostridia bacterium]|nr:hypothetical protein [Clostridia bacterium]